jgi:hypothetical protein
MKKIITLCMAVVTAVTMSAKGMEASAGLVGGLGLGIQGKFMFTENMGLMDELGYFMNLDGGTAKKYGASSYAGLVNNTTFVYQMPITRLDGMRLDWYAGGQAKIGWCPIDWGGGNLAHMGVFGLGAAGGIEAKMNNAPFVFSFDFRPGWAMLFTEQGVGAHLFDYSFNLGVRYRF